jgi:probable rRNA maturation factor
MLSIELANQQRDTSVDVDRLQNAVRLVLSEERIEQATISVAIVDNACIRRLHREYLCDDSPTDVLSFVLERGKASLEGEVIASAETAAAVAAQFGWTVDDELLLYVVHGTLHLVGYDDSDSESLAEMRARERHYLGLFGLAPQYEASINCPSSKASAGKSRMAKSV